MTHTRTTRRIVTATAAIALMASAPGFIGVASAHDHGGNGSGGRDGLTSEQSANPEFAMAIQTARTTYKDATKAVKDQFRTDIAGVRTAIETATATQKAAVKTAHDAYENARDANPAVDTTAQKAALDAAITAYKDALNTAKTAQQAVVTAAADKAKATLATALTTYQTSITEAFATYAAGTTVPPGLLTPGWAHGLGDGKWLNHGLGDKHGHSQGQKQNHQ